jgi:endonuclease/exonuclease/phosphatase family metal-dependent hydrolase
VLQFNLCNSGIASCYTGRSVAAAAAVIRQWRPDIVTLNEVCRTDVSQLARTLSQVRGGTVSASGFEAAVDRRRGGSYRCRNGQPYGVGVLAAGPPSDSGDRRYGGRYPVQDVADPEERVWLCIADDGVYACTTHTASTSSEVALAQCRYLTHQALPALQGHHGEPPVIVGADLNLPSGRSPGIQPCLEHRYGYAGDGSRQDIVASPGFTVEGRAVIDMHGTTDHPALFIELARPRMPVHRDPGSA